MSMVAQQEASLGVMMKGKRTKRPRTLSPALTLATDEGDSSSVEWVGSIAECTEEEDMAHCLILLAQGSKPNNNNNNNRNKVTSSSYECKTCNKSFPTFQALGGHRASHKKPKLMLNLDHQSKKSPTFFPLLDGHRHYHNHQHNHQFNSEEVSLSLQITNVATTTIDSNNNNNHTKPKVHECDICGAEFSSGQALGGHMRRHRPIGGTTTRPSQNVSITTDNPNNNNNNNNDQDKTRNFLSLDLNLPAPEDGNHNQQFQHRDSKFVFTSNDRTLVFSTSSLVDCHY